MSTVTRVFVLLVLVAILGSGIFLATWDMPAPSKQVEVVIPGDQLPK